MPRGDLWVSVAGFVLAASAASAQPDVHVDEDEQDEPVLNLSPAEPEPSLPGPESKRPQLKPRGGGKDGLPPHHKRRPPLPFERGKLGPPGQPGPKHGRFRFFEPDQERRLLEFLKEHFPEMHARIVQQQHNDAETFKRALGRLAPLMINLMEVLRRNPELGKVMIEDYKLEQEIRDVVSRYHTQAIDEPGKEVLKRQLLQLLTEQFDKRQARRRLEIEELQRRIDQQRKRLAEREENKQTLIESELFQRLNPDDQW